MQAVAPTPTPTPPAASPKVDVKLIAPFVDSVRTVFRTMAKVETTVLKPYLKTDAAEYDVFGIIGFSGELTGMVAVSYTQSAAEKLVEAFTGMPTTVTSSHFADAIGELANMIVGSAKSRLGFVANITIPSVILGGRCHMATLSDVPCIVIPCTSALGDFAVEVCIKQKQKKPV